MSALNETLIREVVAEVLQRLGVVGEPSLQPDTQQKAKIDTGGRTTAPQDSGVSSCGCPGSISGSKRLRGRYGVFADAEEACAAAHEAYLQLSAAGVAGRQKVIQLVKNICWDRAQEWARLELEETRIGRLDHKIEKLKSQRSVPGVEFLQPYGLSGDHGITLEEFAPFGVIAAVTPSTHSIPTLACNIITMVAAGNAVVFNAHPGAYRCAVTAVRTFNQAIHQALGIENLACIIEPPTLESFQALARNEHVRLLCVTGGPGVVKAAMASGKRAICAGPGNPPVLVDGTSDLDRAARCVIEGAAYDNNLLCIGEKEVFVLDSCFDRFFAALERHGAVRLTEAQIERLTRAAFVFPQAQGAGCPHPTVNRELVGKDPEVLAQAAGIKLPAGTQLLFGETPPDHPFVLEEQMMPFLPVVRVRTVEEGIEAAKRAEHGYKHSAMIHSLDVAHMTAMARALETTLFVKNGSCLAGLGNGGEGYLNFSIATTTGEGICNPRTFTRVRRCVMVDQLRIF
ncbi:MAG: aldehyde dehydrogenase EutE [Verrucomicrobiota bacterium]|nr:aldehyde dehydrogenase EutE [Limisphaera sp.]MDW8382807.1 aldehyde dehydrogenase EutE [Verrucomicrobiota bacterium]